MRIDQVIEELADAGVYLTVQDGKLVCKARDGALTPERRRLIGEHKADFIAFLDRGTGSGSVPSEQPLTRRSAGPAPLSPTQQRLWFMDQLTGSSTNYLIPVTYRLDGPLDTAALERALQRVVERHESLRTTIAMQEGGPAAHVLDVTDLALQPQSLETLDAAEQERSVSERLQQALAQPFDLARDIPMRAQLLRLGPDVHVLMLVLHHIASDGWSVENLLQELSTLYGAFRCGRTDPLPPLSLQYADYAAWQKQWLQGERLQGALDYWRKQLAGIPATHGLPLDRPRPAHALRAGGSWRQRMSSSLHVALLELGRRRGATLFMTMQAAYAVLIARWGAVTTW